MRLNVAFGQAVLRVTFSLQAPPSSTLNPFVDCMTTSSGASVGVGGHDLGSGWKDLALSIDQLIGLFGRWALGITLITWLPYLLVNGLPGWPDWEGWGEAVSSILMWTAIGLFVYAVSALIHEVLHVAAMLLIARIPIGSLRFGARLSEGVLFVHTDQPMSARSYRVILIAPAVVQGMAPVVIGTMAGLGWLVLYGYVMLLSSIGDLAVFQLIRHLRGANIVRDHPSKVGCQVWIAEK